MGLGATYRIERPARRHTSFGADLVGSPTLGPTAFMHRESARDNPQVPLTHHDLDSTHITPGVLRAGVEAGPLTFEASVFRGEEPDENRFNIETAGARFVVGARRLASRSVAGAVLRRAAARAGVVRAVRHHAADRVDRRSTARSRSRPLAATLAWGQNREVNGVQNGRRRRLSARSGTCARTDAIDDLRPRREVCRETDLRPRAPPEGLQPSARLTRTSMPLTLGFVRDICPVANGAGSASAPTSPSTACRPT